MTINNQGNSVPQWMLELEKKLHNEFTPTILELEDDSWQHAGHKGALEHGGAHLSLLIVAEKFAGLSRMQRHRQIYMCLQPWMKQHVHALALKVFTPMEWEKKS